MTVIPTAPTDSSDAAAPDPEARQEPQTPPADTARTSSAPGPSEPVASESATSALLTSTPGISASEPSGTTPRPAAEPTVIAAPAPAPADGPAGATVVPGPRPETAALGQQPEQDPQPEPEPEPGPVSPAVDRAGAEAGPRVRAVRVDRPAGARGQAGAEPRTEPGTKPRLGAVPAPEPSRADAASRRRSVPTVRAVRLTAEPAAPARRPAPAPAAVTPVPLPLPVPPPRPVTDDVPPESRTEEPQP
ncbi:hypothetical protein OG357_32965 [Streptomyces sp. NBC_01255]|uniref:hypothetical protein n=1 Tax=Streptomyces sp. NBC_01255 TaxID=2903798 RepID=UPI002E3718ED|nr:hypothetical protein [Streptomyces sp. NBC_01255]